MGAYLSQPNTEKISTDESNEFLACGASSMQGWRMSQEDAHSCILDFDKNSSFFAVYDGHGGREVAVYTALHLPEFLKKIQNYKEGNFEEALKEAFLGLDATLISEAVIEELKKIVYTPKREGESDTDEDADAMDDEDDLAELRQEGRMPLSELLEKYKEGKNPAINLLKESEASGSKPISPYLRGRRNANGVGGSEEGEAESDAAGGAGSSTSNADKSAGSSSSSSSEACSKGRKLNVTDAGEAESTVSSSSTTKQTPEQAANEVASSSSSGITSNGNGPTSCSSSSSSEAADSNKQSEKLNSSSPVSSSTNNKNASQPNELSASSSSDAKSASSENTNNANATQRVVNGEEASSASASSPAAVATAAGASTVESQQESEISSGKAENVSSSSSRTIENGEVTSNTATTNSTVEKSSLNNISSTNDARPRKSGKRFPGLEDDDEDEEDTTSDDGSYNEDKSSTDEGEDYPMNYGSDECDEEDEEEEEEDDFNDDEDEEDAGFLNSMNEAPGYSSGCTAVVALLTGRDLYVANAGDSRCVVCRDGKAYEMSFDHKPEDLPELERIKKAGGRVTLDGRVNGGLNLSRAIGDHAYKFNTEIKPEEQMISALPDIKKLTIGPTDDFMILACDGIWNFMTSEEVVDFVKERLADGREKISSICEELFTNCLAANTLGDGTGCDNMTAVIIQFKTALKQNNIEMTEAVADTNSRKRLASPVPVVDDESCKRVKTDPTTESSTTTSSNNETVAVADQAAADKVVETSTT